MVLLFSLVFPIVIKLFLKIGVIFDVIWDLFNMLQLIANILNLCVPSEIPRDIIGRLNLPACVLMILINVNFTVNFKPFENEIVIEYVQKYKGLVSISDFVKEQGLVFLAMMAAIIIIPLLLILKKLSEKFVWLQK